MTSITYIGMDVHSTNYTLCAFTMEGKKVFGRTTINPDIRELVKYLETLSKQLGGNTEFECGYEAGCLGYTLYHELTARGYKCVILAPTTMPSTPKEIKILMRADLIDVLQAFLEFYSLFAGDSPVNGGLNLLDRMLATSINKGRNFKLLAWMLQDVADDGT